jgi:broad specificity phosphatase PhoE
VFTSPLERANETAALVHAHLALPTPVQPDPRLLEAQSLFDGLPRAFAPGAYVGRLLRRGLSGQREAPRTVADRMVNAVLDLSQQAGGSAIALVSHELPIRLCRLALEQRARGNVSGRLPARTWGPRPPYASVTTLHLDEWGLLLASSLWPGRP